MSSAVRVKKKTLFFSWHVAHGATLYEKGDWVRPAEYPQGPVAEHLCVRTAVGIIDAHSMGKYTVEGPGAADLLDFAATNRIADLAVGRARYTCLCDDDGGILDDVIVYRTGPAGFYLITNTLSRERVGDALRSAAGTGTCVHDVSSSIAYLAVQGPRSRDLLVAAGCQSSLDDEALPYFGCVRTTIAGVDLLLARTGYTGELGYELNAPAEWALDLWT